jgi:ligand-binding sensor domain-containing protein
MVVRGITRGKDGRLWMATDRGVVAYDGQRTQRVDRRSGLLEERVEDIAVDHQGRVWARSRQGFSLVTP